MKTWNFAYSAVLAAGFLAAQPASTQAQYPGQYGGYGGPAQSATAEQRKQVKEAEAEVIRIRADMTKIKARTQAKYEAKEEWETAKKDLKDAESAYQSARRKVISKLNANPQYKAAAAKALKADKQLSELQADPKASAKEFDKAHQARLEAGLALRKMETSAMAADPNVAETKQKLADARKTWDALQDEVKESLEQDPEYVAAQDMLTQAQEAHMQMKMSLAQTAAGEREARRAAAESRRSAGTPPRSGGGGRGYGGIR